MPYLDCIDIGWVLRDYSYTDANWMAGFVRENGSRLSPPSCRKALKPLRRSRTASEFIADG